MSYQRFLSVRNKGEYFIDPLPLFSPGPFSSKGCLPERLLSRHLTLIVAKTKDACIMLSVGWQCYCICQSISITYLVAVNSTTHSCILNFHNIRKIIKAFVDVLSLKFGFYRITANCAFKIHHIMQKPNSIIVSFYNSEHKLHSDYWRTYMYWGVSASRILYIKQLLNMLFHDM